MSNSNVRMGTAYAPASYFSAQGSRVEQMGDLRVSDARLRLSGLREGDARLRLGALRERDANISLGTAYAPAAYYSAQGSRVEQLGDMRGEDARLRLGAYADQDSAGAFQSKMCGAGLGVRGKKMVVNRGNTGTKSTGGGSGSRNAAAGYDERDQRSVIVAMRKPGPDIGFRERPSISTLFASGAIPVYTSGRHQMGALREKDASIRLGDLRAEDSATHLGAADFHARFPVKIEMKGLGSATHMLSKSQISGLFDFLKANPSDAENMSRVQAIINWWGPIRNAIANLPAAKQSAAIAAISNLDTSVSNIDFVVANYPNLATFDREEMNRMTRIEAAEPAINKLMADMQAFSGPGGAAGAAANASILKTVNGQASAIETGLSMQNVAVAVVGGAVGIGVIFAIVKAFQKN